jgi:mannose-6-phosphate isomerase-like protein (cupin superfamily)
MEMIDIKDIEEFEEHKVVKKVPLLSNDLMGSLLFIGSDTNMLPVRTKGSNEMHLVLEGDGGIEMDGKTRKVGKGTFMLIPPHSRYRYTTKDNEMIVLVVKQVNGSRSEKAEGEV